MNTIIDYTLIGQRIKQCRLDHHITQEQLAEDSHLSTFYISKIENGKVTPPIETLAVIADCLQIDFVLLITGTSTLEQHYHLGKLQSIVEKATNRQLELIYKLAKVILEE